MDSELFGEDYWEQFDAKKVKVANQIQHAQGIADAYPTTRPYCNACCSFVCGC